MADSLTVTMPTILETLRRWIYSFRAEHGEQPAFLPITVEELGDVIHEAAANLVIPISPYDGPPSIYGIPYQENPFAVNLRERQVQIPFMRFEEVEKFDVRYEPSLEQMEERFRARICTHTTKLRVTFEWDVLARLKRALRITRWFPVKKRAALIDGRTLYPFLRIDFPHNRHYAQFQVREG